MAAWRYEISLFVLKKYFSTLEEKFRISARPCNILDIMKNPLKGCFKGLFPVVEIGLWEETIFLCFLENEIGLKICSLALSSIHALEKYDCNTESVTFQKLPVFFPSVSWSVLFLDLLIYMWSFLWVILFRRNSWNSVLRKKPENEKTICKITVRRSKYCLLRNF